MNRDKGFQKLFFDSIKQRLPHNISVVHEISELLEISYDSAYRRLRGDKELSIEEVKLLSARYHISIDSLFGLGNADVLFHPFTFEPQENGFEEWLQMILELATKIDLSKGKEVILVARDLPVYYYFDFPELVAFKIYFWKKMLLHFPGYHDKVFNINEIPESLLTSGRKILSIYNRIPTIEIWCQETFTRIIHQVEFCRESGFFAHKHDAEILFDKLESLFRHVQYQTEQGFKFPFGKDDIDTEDQNFKVFLNEVLVMDNTVFVQNDGVKTIFMTYNSLNLLVTTNTVFCKQVENALRILMKTGNLISGTSALQCSRFFNSLYERLAEIRKDAETFRLMV